MSVTWVLNGSSKYEVSSKEHLLQIMTQGTLYTDSGTPPADYWSDDYEQTVDIDLGFDANITPIGVSSGDNFNGTYDGGNFSISNWSFSATSGFNYIGLFGHMNGGILENIKLAGVWTFNGISSWAGFLVGQALSATLRNIECTFDEGTTMDVLATYVGGFSGETFFANTYGITVRGFINLNITTTGSKGGIIGRIRAGNHVGLRNSAVWANGISGSMVGGIVGELGGDSNLTYCMNSMVGDITGNKCGGICGYNQRGGGTDPFRQMVNSMNGTITGTTYAGGIVGETYGDYGSFEAIDTMNYMTGNIVATNNTSGGIIGFASRRTSTYTANISNSINAMNGNVDEVAIGASGISTSVSMNIDTSFGLTYTSATYGSTSDIFTGTTSILFTDLDYIPLVFTDDASNSYEYEMVFGNVGGNASYSQYTHVILFKDDIAGPYFIDFDLTGNSTGYLAYITAGASPVAYTNGSLTVLNSSANFVYDYSGSVILFTKPLPTSFEVTGAGAINITVTITAITGADAYQLRYAPTSGGTPVVAHSGFTDLTKVISNLDPEVEYQVSLYYLPTGLSVYTLDGSKTATTLANVSANYDVSAYGSGGEYDLSGIINLGNISEVMNDIFTSGDKISIDLGRPIKTTFVKLGDTLAIPEDSALFPFTPSNGASQQVTLTLPDTTTQTITYNEVSEEITVGGNTYSDGDAFILNGKKAKVFNV